MRDDEVVALLKRHQRGFTRGHGRSVVDRRAVEHEVGEDRIAEIDKWVAARDGTVVRGRIALARRLRPGPTPVEQYELPPEVLAPTADTAPEEPHHSL
jgi:hypothetical protein